MSLAHLSPAHMTPAHMTPAHTSLATATTADTTWQITDASGPLVVVGVILLILGLLLVVNRFPRR